MNSKNIAVAVSTLVAGAAITYFVSTGATAFQGGPNVKGPNYSPERHEAMQKAFEDNDYQSWKKLMEERKPRVMDVVNEQNFPKFAEAHRLAEEGKFEEANKIREELGLRNMGHMGKGQGHGRWSR